jgi:arylsulfatase A-like enzyme
MTSMTRLLRHCLYLAAMMAGAANAAPVHRVIVFVWDGMRPDALTQSDTPNLTAMVNGGTFFTDNHATYPTFTMVNASSFATGAFPGTIGFYGNRFWAPDAKGRDAKGAPVDFSIPVFTEDYAVLSDLDARSDHAVMSVQTLLQAAQKKGLKTAAVGKSGPAFLQDVRHGGVVLDENVAMPLAFAQALGKAGYPLPANTPNAYDGALELEPDNGTPTAQLPTVKLRDGVSSDASDAGGAPPTASNAWLMKVYLEYILPKIKPDISVVWLRNPDSTEHVYGPGSPNFHLAVQAQDALLGQLLARLRALHMDQDTDLIVVSDHGHSNVSGPTDLFPLRAINDGRVAAVDPQWGFSVSGGVRMADLLTRGGFKAFDGMGCIYAPVQSGIRADGSQAQPTHYDDDGHICGKPGPYTTPAYPIPAKLPADAFVLAPNGGSEYLYQPAHDKAVVARAVRYLQAQEPVGVIFVDRRYGRLPGTFPLDMVHIAGRDSPDVVLSYDYNAEAMVQGFPGTLYSSMSTERGMHGSFSPVDVHNTFVARGPSFREGFRDALPSGNVDLAPTVAAIFGLSLPKAQGRVLSEALTGKLSRQEADYRVTSRQASAEAVRGLAVKRIDGSAAGSSSYAPTIYMKDLTLDGRTWTYFDRAKAARDRGHPD